MRAVLKEELSITETRLTGRITEVEAGLGHLKEDMRGLEKRVESVEERLRKETGMGRIEDNSLVSILGTNSPGPNAKLNRYWKARCSLRMWPIKGNGAAIRIELQKFLSQKLRLGEDVLTDIKDCSIRRIPSGNKNSPITNEVTVEFPSAELRDVVRGSAFNLAGHPEAGIRLEVPHHLMSNFKALNAASYRLKKKFSSCHRNIKYDDEHYDLVLDFKTGQEAPWRKLGPLQARELLREEGGDAEEMSVADMTDLLGGDGGDEDKLSE